MSRVYLNGQYLAAEEARINVLDRGFTFGDGVYEVIPVFNRKVFRFEQHMQRLENSLQAIFIESPLQRAQWQTLFEDLVNEFDAPDQSIYLQVTRGVSERDHDIALAESPTVFAMSRPLQKKASEAGIKAITHEDIRWAYCHIKAITLLPSVLLRHLAREQGAREAILIKDDHVTEGAASNVFLVRDGTVFTSPKNNEVLPGITRDLVLELLDQADIPFSEQVLPREWLPEADEIWITSSTWEIVPVTELDGKLVADGRPGPVWQQVQQIYQHYKQVNCQ